MPRHVLTLSIAALVCACATVEPLYSPQDVQQAATPEQQTALYQRIRTDLAAETNEANATLYRQLLSDLGDRIGGAEADGVRRFLEQQRLPSGLVPLDQIDAARDHAESVRPWSTARFQQLAGELEQLQLQTETTIADIESSLPALVAAGNLVGRVTALQRIRELRGNDADTVRAHETALEQAVTAFLQTAQSALAVGDGQSALDAYQRLQAVAPDYPGLQRLIANARAALRAEEFRDLLLAGNTEDAYRLFGELSGEALSREMIARFETPALLLADFYANNADSFIAANQHADAYAQLRRSRAIREWVGRFPANADAVVTRFTDAMFDLATAAGARDLQGLEYGFLLLLEEFDPRYNTLESLKRDVSEAVYEDAVRRLGTVTLADTASGSRIGARIAAQVNQHLLENVPDDVRLVERENLAEIERERGLDEGGTLIGLSAADLRPADLLIQGSVLEARVDTQVDEGRRRMRVITARNTVPNPDYLAFVERRGRRAETDPEAPPRTIVQEVEEDVTIGVQFHRKSGSVGITYRIVDADTARIMHTRSISRSAEFTDESSEGVELGIFRQELEVASLPPDSEILNRLAVEVAAAMSEDLVALLANLESDYLAQCRTLEGQGEAIQAADLCAKAAVLTGYKAGDVSAIESLLKRVTLASGMRPD